MCVYCADLGIDRQFKTKVPFIVNCRGLKHKLYFLHSVNNFEFKNILLIVLII